MLQLIGPIKLIVYVSLDMSIIVTSSIVRSYSHLLKSFPAGRLIRRLDVYSAAEWLFRRLDGIFAPADRSDDFDPDPPW